MLLSISSLNGMTDFLTAVFFPACPQLLSCAAVPGEAPSLPSLLLPANTAAEAGGWLGLLLAPGGEWASQGLLSDGG